MEVVSVKMELIVVKLVAVWVGVVFSYLFALSDGFHFRVRPWQAVPRPLVEMKSRGLVSGPLLPLFL